MYSQLRRTMSSTVAKFAVGYITVPPQSGADGVPRAVNIAEELATKLVEAGLVACVNIVPSVTSIYKWEGKIQKDQEQLLIIKTPLAKADGLVDFVKANHPYSVPEVILTPIVAGNPAYLNWLCEATDDVHR